MQQVARDFFGEFAKYWRMTQRWLPQGWLDALRQLALFGGAYYFYRIVRGLVDGQAALAFENARSLVDAERAMGLFFEPGLQSWVQAHAHFLLEAANFNYVNSQFVVTTTFLIWLYIFRNPSFYYVRNMFTIAMLLALVGYMAFPAAPPRFLPEWGFTDTVSSFVGAQAEQNATVLYNPFAAVPSMHVAFSLMIAVPAIQIVRHRLGKVLWSLYPLAVTFTVIVTANHFWLDAALGAMVAALSASAASFALARARPEAWAWRTAPREAVA